MTSALQANADTAQSSAAALLELQPYAGPTSAQTACASLAAELSACNIALLELRTALTDPLNVTRRALIEEDRYVVLKSLEFTLRDLRRLFDKAELPPRTARGAAATALRRDRGRALWVRIDDYFRAESNNALQSRMMYYRKFLKDCTRQVMGHLPSQDVDNLYAKINGLLKIQEDRMEEDLKRLAIGTSRQPSWERVRNAFNVHSRPNGAVPRRDSYTSPISPLTTDDEYFPTAPEPPRARSPSIATAATSSTNTTYTSSSSGGVGTGDLAHHDHWLPAVFRQSRPTTVFRSTAAESACHAPHKPHVQARIDEQDYDRLETFPFEAGLEVRVFVRAADRRARLLCRVERGGQRTQASVPCTMLRVDRRDSALQLCTVDEKQRFILWAHLRFPSYERLVLFHAAFLALKAQDEAHPVRELHDTLLEGEVALFAGRIIDDNYEHTLKVLKDANSGGIRLLASAARGDLRRCPIWTAFINYHVAAHSSRHAPPWARRAEQRKVFLGDLNRYIFTTEYEPHFGPNGEHELCFELPSDAKDFLDIIEDLAHGRI